MQEPTTEGQFLASVAGSDCCNKELATEGQVPGSVAGSGNFDIKKGDAESRISKKQGLSHLRCEREVLLFREQLSTSP